MRVTDIEVGNVENGARLRATVEWARRGRGPDEVSFVYRGVREDALVTPGDALAATAFMPAMAHHEDLVIDAPVSRRLRDGMERVADIWTGWMPRWRRPVVTSEVVDRSSLWPTRIAACFSAGVDSYFAVLRPEGERVDLLLTMLGFASPALVATGRLEVAMSQIADAAKLLGIEHVIVDSNAYVFCAKYLPTHRRYRNLQQGAVLAAMAVGLGSMVRKCLIGSGFARQFARPWGTHPDVDPLWSTEATEIVHHGAHLTREEKIPVVAQSDVALQTLRVCRQMELAEGNCRTCDKCRQTALALGAIGAIDRCPTLDRVTPEQVRKTIIVPRHFGNYRRVRERVDDPDLKAAITSAIRRSQLRRLARPLGWLLRQAGVR